MVTNVNYAYADHFSIYANIKSCCILETNIMLYANYISKNKQTKWWRWGSQAIFYLKKQTPKLIPCI